MPEVIKVVHLYNLRQLLWQSPEVVVIQRLLLIGAVLRLSNNQWTTGL
ncbi:MAG: hypothetical protein HKO90_08575 [Flavobacteriaceae bacterium]|nr:hypothetical protein [Flavobacteriaceae bacterium]